MSALRAASQQEQDEQHGDGHAKRPQQDPSGFSFLRTTPLRQLFHNEISMIAAFAVQGVDSKAKAQRRSVCPTGSS